MAKVTNSNRSNEGKSSSHPGEEAGFAQDRARGRKPWTAPRLKTLDARAAGPGPSITDGSTWYVPVGG